MGAEKVSCRQHSEQKEREKKEIEIEKEKRKSVKKERDEGGGYKRNKEKGAKDEMRAINWEERR